MHPDGKCFSWRLTPRQQLWDTVPWSQIASVGSVGLASPCLASQHCPRGRVPNDYSGQSHSSRHFLCQDLRHSAHGLLADCQMRSIPSFQMLSSHWFRFVKSAEVFGFEFKLLPFFAFFEPAYLFNMPHASWGNETMQHPIVNWQ